MQSVRESIAHRCSRKDFVFDLNRYDYTLASPVGGMRPKAHDDATQSPPPSPREMSVLQTERETPDKAQKTDEHRSFFILRVDFYSYAVGKLKKRKEPGKDDSERSEKNRRSV